MNTTNSGAVARLPFLHRLTMVFPIGLLASLALGPIGPALADDSVLVEGYAAEHTAGRLEDDSKPDPLRSGPLFAVVSIADQRISVYGSGGLVARAPVSTGMRGHSTPTGVFSIVQKQRWHESNIYSGAPMPFMQRITWSGIALHQGVVPGHPASHGCIRLPGGFAQRLFGGTEIGHRVIVAPWDTVPVEITHANLPAPKLSPAPGVAVSSAPDSTASIVTAQASDDAVLEPASLQQAPAAAGLLNPLEFARAMKSDANGKARAASRAAREAMLAVARKTSELRLSARKLAGAENAAEEAAGDVAAAVRRLEKTDGKEAIAEAAEAKGEAEAALAEALKVKDARIAKAIAAVGGAEAALVEALKVADARVAKATEAQALAEAALVEARKAAENVRGAKPIEAEAGLIEARRAEQTPMANVTEVKSDAGVDLIEARQAEEGPIVNTTEAKNEAGVALIEAQKAAEDARVAMATEAKSETEARKAEDTRIANAIEAKTDADEALAETRKAEDARIAKATEVKTEAEADLAETRKAEDARIAKATEARTEAEAGLIEAEKAEDARIVKATEARNAAEAALAGARQAAEDARTAKDAKALELAAARNAAAEARTAGKVASETLAEATRRLKPLSVFISRKTGRLYVRQNFQPLFDVPVSIRDADQDIGTHVFVSTRAAEDNSALYWQAVSMPVADSRPARREGKGRGTAQDNAPASEAAAPLPEAETARGALDRVTIPEDTSRRLAELAWIGATVTISDFGISGETGPTTDFIILTKPRTSTR